MAAIGGATALTLADWAKRVDDDGKTAIIVELLSQYNPILDEMLVVEGNLPTGHKTTLRTSLPAVSLRPLNQGVLPSKSTTAQIVEGISNMEAYSQVDKDLADLHGDTAEFRMSEDMSFVESLNQQMANLLFYGNPYSNPAEFLGLTARYNATSSATANTADNVIDAGGTGSTNASIWTVGWGPNTIAGIFPKGKLSGLQHIDMGEWPVLDAANGLYQAYRTHFKWELGLSVRDWRFAVRIANIDTTLLNGSSAPNLINALIRAVNRLPIQPSSAGPIQDSDAPRPLVYNMCAIYCNRVIRTALDLQAVNKTNLLLRIDEWAGKPVLTFRGVPIRNADALLSTETRVV